MEDWSAPAQMDRELQRKLLKAMEDAYPQALTQPPAEINPESKTTLANLLYLDDHGLCKANIERYMGFPGMGWGHPIITAAGLDFLTQDGGLKAILSVVTIRFEAETLKALLEKEVDETTLPDEEKSLLKKHLKTLPETVLKTGMNDLVAEGLKALPDAAGWLRTLVGL